METQRAVIGVMSINAIWTDNIRREQLEGSPNLILLV
jgi:hypothetical protein